MKRVPGGWFIHPFEVAVSGYSGAGKTTFLEKLIDTYRRRQWSVGYVKRDAHFFSLDVPGKDTYRAREAGAVTTCIEDRTQSAVITDHGPKGPSLAAVQQAVATRDIVFVEGRKYSPLPKIVMLDPRGEIDEELKSGKVNNLIALVYPSGEEKRAQGCLNAGTDVPMVCRDDVEKIVEVVDRVLAARIPAVSALVLLGGHSTRMGQDKSALDYGDGTSAARRMVNLVSSVCDDVYLSIRPGQEIPEDVREMSLLEDRFIDFGPAGGILTALYQYPDRAWLVVSCDLPLLEEADLRLLTEARDPYKIATALAVPNERDGEEPLLPEPLCAIWEPRARSRILSFFQEGSTCPRWLLRNGGVSMVQPINTLATFNANTPEERETARRLLAERRSAGQATVKGAGR